MLEMLRSFLEVPFTDKVFEINYKDRSYLLLCNDEYEILEIID